MEHPTPNTETPCEVAKTFSVPLPLLKLRKQQTATNKPNYIRNLDEAINDATESQTSLGHYVDIPVWLHPVSEVIDCDGSSEAGQRVYQILSAYQTNARLSTPITYHSLRNFSSRRFS